MSLPIAVFGVVKAVVFRPLPFLEADRLVTAYVPLPAGSAGRLSLLYAIQRGSRSIVRSAAYSHSPTVVGPSGEARTLTVARVSPTFFDVIGARPTVGSGFDGQSDGRGDWRVLISHALWSSHYGSDRSAIGARIIVGGESRVIVGVMSEGFDFPRGASLWLPMIISSDPTLQSSAYYILGRLRESASLGAAAAEVASINRSVQAEVTPIRPVGLHLLSMRDYLFRNLRVQLALWSAVAVVVAILCAVNFATMSFARGMARRHEIALRRAVGGSITRVTGELVTESATTAFAGGLLTMPLSLWLMKFADTWLSEGTLAVASRIDWLTAGFGILATTAVGVGFALLPAIDVASIDLRSVMQSASPGTTSRGRELRSRKALVGLQVTLALTATALVAALVLADRRYQQAEATLDYSRLLTATVSSIDTSLGPIELKGLTDNLTGSAGLEAAAVLNACDDAVVVAHGGAIPRVPAIACNASVTLFAALGMKPLAGRLPSQDEVLSNAAVVVVMQSVANRLFGTSALAIGRSIDVARRGWEPRPREVIGVVNDIGDELFGYAPAIIRAQDIRMRTGASLVVRVRRDPHSYIRGFADAVQSVDTRIMVSDVAAATDVVNRGRLRTRGRDYFLMCVAVLAVGLAIIGVFSLTAYATALRSREFGIRLALGAAPRGIVWLVISELRWSAAIGLAVGLLASFQLTSWLDSMMRPSYLQEPLITLPVAPLFASTLALLLILTLGAGVPVRRMLRMDVGRVISAE